MLVHGGDVLQQMTPDQELIINIRDVAHSNIQITFKTGRMRIYSSHAFAEALLTGGLKRLGVHLGEEVL